MCGRGLRMWKCMQFLLKFLLSGNTSILAARDFLRAWWVGGWPPGIVWVGLHLTVWTPDLRTWTLESAWMWPGEVWMEARSVGNNAGGRMVLGYHHFFLFKGEWRKGSFSFLFHHKWPCKSAAFKLRLWSIVRSTFYILCVHIWNSKCPYYF